ncbi:MAG: type II secretion system protein GspL [Alphaproteobacteria bacterium]
MSLTRLVILARAVDFPASVIVADGAGMVVTTGSLRPGGPPPPRMRTILVIPGEEVLTRWIALTAASLDQARAAAAMMLQDDLAQPREALHFALGEPGPDGLRPVCVIARTALEARLVQARSLGFTPDVVVPDCLMLPPAEGEDLIAALLGEVTAVRGRNVAFTAETALAEQLMAGREAERLDDGPRIAGLLAATAAPVNLLQGDFGRRSAKPGGWRRAAVLAGLALASPLIIQAAHIARDDMAAERIERATAAKGDTQRLVSVGESMRKGRDFNGAMSAVFKALERMPGAKLQSLSYRAEGTMRLTLVHDNYSDVATLAGALGPSGLALRDDGSTEAGGRISTDLTLTRAK